jgi:predicted amidophosphoribosyltransferase
VHLTREQVEGLARKRQCPRCDFNKTVGNALCRRCRAKLPPHMRQGVENIPDKEPTMVGRALRAAANYFEVHFASIRKFGGGKKYDK